MKVDCCGVPLEPITSTPPFVSPPLGSSRSLLMPMEARCKDATTINGGGKGSLANFSCKSPPIVYVSIIVNLEGLIE